MSKPTRAPSSLRAKAKQVMRQGLLEIADELLRTEGIQALSTRRVAERAGVSTTAIYTLFGGKDGLTEALYLQGFDRLTRALEVVAQHENPIRSVLNLCHMYRQVAKQYPVYYALMFEHVLPGYEPSANAKAAAWQSLQPLVEAIKAARAAKLLWTDNPEDLAMRVWVASHGLVSIELSGYMPKALQVETMHRAIVLDLLRASGATLETVPT